MSKLKSRYCIQYLLFVFNVFFDNNPTFKLKTIQGDFFYILVLLSFFYVIVALMNYHYSW